MSNEDIPNAMFDVIIVLGYPGSGKGTQCSKIEMEYQYHHISTGNILQKATLNPNLEYGELIKKHRLNGTIVPHAITCKLLIQEMRINKNISKFIIDGFPRNEDNYIGWKEILEKCCTLKCIIFIECSKAVCIERCKRRNRDCSDLEEIIIKRLQQFDEETVMILNRFGAMAHKVNGNQAENKVYDDIRKILNETLFSKMVNIATSENFLNYNLYIMPNEIEPKPISMSRPKSWNAEVENAYRFQIGGYRDEIEYKAIRGHLVEKWPDSGFVKKIHRKDGYFNYFDKDRECPDKDIPKCKLYTY